MIPKAYLRVYEPESSFPSNEAAEWLRRAADAEPAERPGRYLVTGSLPEGRGLAAEGAYVRTVGGRTYICPWRTRLRMLAGLLAFRESVPEEVADAFVPPEEAGKAARELAELDARFPRVRSHILHANWHVPLRWFVAFAADEHILVEDRNGLRVRYETTVARALERLDEGISVLDSAWADDSVASALEELRAWLSEFSAEALLELDYGGVARLLDEDRLVDENCAAEIAACLQALAAGEMDRAIAAFDDLSERWARVRALEILN